MIKASFKQINQTTQLVDHEQFSSRVHVINQSCDYFTCVHNKSVRSKNFHKTKCTNDKLGHDVMLTS